MVAKELPALTEGRPFASRTYCSLESMLLLVAARAEKMRYAYVCLEEATADHLYKAAERIVAANGFMAKVLDLDAKARTITNRATGGVMQVVSSLKVHGAPMGGIIVDEAEEAAAVLGGRLAGDVV